jgi:hypothetical protein
MAYYGNKMYNASMPQWASFVKTQDRRCRYEYMRGAIEPMFGMLAVEKLNCI